MARPMVLIKEPLLKELYFKHKDGVKYNTLIRRYKLSITGPTLKKLIRYYSILLGTNNSDIQKSLFPSWLKNNVQHQNSAKWIYIGVMPLGKWEKRLLL